MIRKHASILGLLLALATGVGCAAGPASSGAPTPQADAASAPAQQGETEASQPEPQEGAIPEGSKVACHLNCSGTESTTYGPTEEEARATAVALVKTQCRPEDGQYFLVCEPLE